MTQPEDDNRSLLASQPLITEAKTRPIEHPEVEVPRPAELLPEDKSYYDLTAWDKITLTIGDTIKHAKVAMVTLPHLITFIGGLAMKNWKTTIGAIIAGVATVLSALGIVAIPAEVQTGILAVALFIIGLFARDASNKDATEN